MRFLLVLGMSAIFIAGHSQTTSWRGTSSSVWATAANWTAGVPTATIDAVLGDANFTGTFQPSVTATSNCKSLTVGGGSRSTTLTVNAAIVVATNVTISTLGTVSHTANTITVRGNWSVTGTYTPTVTTATVVFGGTTQAINNTTTFSRLTINSGSTTSLAANVTVTNAFVVGGIFDPVNASQIVTLTGSTFTVNPLGRIKVYAATFSGNYSVNPTTLDPRGIVEYASTSINQTIAVLGYGTLTISGGTVKTLGGNTTLQSTSTAGGNVTLSAGTLDLGSFTLNRNAAGGGTFSVSNGAQLLIGGTNSVPTNYNTTTLGATSTVVYGGDNQTITAKTYGHLIITGTTGSVIKTFPATAMTIAGNFSSTVGTATSVTYNANAAITTTGNISIGASTIFNGGAATHILAGNWTNDGTYNGNTGAVRFNRASGLIAGAGVQNFNNITVAGNGITCSSGNVTLTGNLATTGTGTFVHNAGSTITFSGTTKTVTGTGINLSNVVMSGSVTTTASFIIGGNITTSGSFGATAGTITFSGATPVIGGAGTTTFFAVIASGALSTSTNFSMRSNLSGAGKLTATAGTVSFIGTTTISGAHDLFNATINGTRLQLGANSTLSIAGALTITAGTLNTTTTVPNTLIYNGAGSQNIAAATYYNLILANNGTKTASGAILPKGNFTINTGVTFNASTFAHTISGNWINQGTFVPSTSTITFNGATNSTITGTTAFNILTVSKTAAATTLTLNNNVNAVTVNMTQGRMLTGVNSITITGTRAGNAIILGTITRTHAFVANTSYAFEGANTSITFTTIVGSVTSVTVTVLSAQVADFPSLNAVNRSYNVSIANTGTYVATLRLHYEDTELNGDTEANLSLWRFVTGTWTSYGKTTNDVTNNYVQRTLQSDISGRWTFYDGSVTHVWKGTTNTAWTTATNWKAGVVPSSVDNILIGTETFTNQPTITTAITAKSIVFGGVKAAALTIGGTVGSLTVTGNVSGDWTADQTHTLNVGSRVLAIAGDLTLSNGNNARKIQLTLSTGTTTVTGSVIQPGAGSIVFSGAGAMSIGLDYIYSGGTFTASTGTVTYNGSGSQAIAGGIVYNNLLVSKPAGVATLSTASTINGSLTTSLLSEVTLDAQLNVLGNVSFATGTILNANAALLNTGGNWSFAGTLNATTGAVVFNGTGNQSVSQSTFNDVIINKTAGVATLTGDLVINGDLTVTAGTIDIVSFSVNRSTTGGGTFSLSNGASLRLAGASNFPANYDTQILGSSSSVVYNGATQNITPTTYGNLILSNAGTKSFSASTPTEAINLTINAATTLPIAAALTLKGNLINNSSFNIAAGSSIAFSGSSTQTISGTATTDFQDITVSNLASPGVSIESNQNLRGVLTVESNASIDADGTANTSIFRIMSSADNPTQDGAIDILPAGAAILGNITVQRYMFIEGPSGGRINRYVSSPVKNATVADMQHEIPVTGPFTGSSVCSGCAANASMLAYDETVTTGGINGGFTGFPISGNSETFQTGRGYSMFVRGNLLTTALWDLRGPINSGSINLPVSFTSSGTLADDGWNLVGNPYASTIDWNAATGWDKNNLDGTIYIRDNGGPSGQFATWNGVTGTNGGSQYIAAGQAFWVKAEGTLPSLSLDENVKTPRMQATFFRQTAPDNLLRATLSKDGVRDETVIHFRNDASNEFDEAADALKVLNVGFNLSTQLEGQDKLAINSLNLSDCSISVPLLLDNVLEGTYILSFDNVDSFTSGTSIMLVDNFTNTTTDTRLNPTYSFDINDDIASLDSARFVVKFIMQPAPMDYSILASSVCPDLDAKIELAQTSERVKYQVTVNGVEVFSDSGNGGSAYITLPAGMLMANDNSVNVAAIPNDACGTVTEKSTTLAVVKAEEPTPSISENICREGAATLTASGAATGQQYRWYADEGDSVSLGTESSYTTPTLRKSHVYYVSIESGAGCTSKRVPVQANVINFDDPIVSFTNDELSVDYPGMKQWYFNDEIIVNDTLSFITPKQNGVYSVVIPVQSCLAKATYELAITGLGERPANSLTLKVYPNPVKDYLYIDAQVPEVENVSIYNLSGQRVGRFDLAKGSHNMEKFPAGIYFLIAEGRNGTTKVKVIKE
jgi:fibronectin-binding autotransporter adhesin